MNISDRYMIDNGIRLSFDEIVRAIRVTIPISKLRNGSLPLGKMKREKLMNRDVIQLFRNLLQELAVKCDGVAFRMNARDLLVAYLFAYYDFDDTMKNVALELINFLHDGDMDAVSPRPLARGSPQPFVTRLGVLIKAYEVAYLTWKPIDKAELMEEMCRLYWEYELVFRLNEANMTSEEVSGFRAQKESRQQSLINAMQSIDDLKAFSSFAPPVVFESSTVEQIKRTLALAFWNLVREDIQQQPPIMDRIFSVFGDIRQHLVYICSENSRIIEEFDDIMDPQFVAQIYQDRSAEFWTSRCSFLIRTLGALDSQHMEAVHTDWWKAVRDSAADDHAGTINACIHCLSYFMDHIEKLHEIVKAAWAL